MNRRTCFATPRLVGVLLAAVCGSASIAVAAPTDYPGFRYGDVGVIFHGNSSRIDRIVPEAHLGACESTTLLPSAQHPSLVFTRDDANEISYDSFRDRLLFVATIGGVHDVWALSADGTVAPLGYTNVGNVPLPKQIAPAGDGRVYFHASPYILMLDASGTTVILLDETGAPYVSVQGSASAQDMVYDPASNALFTVHGHGSGQGMCSTGSGLAMCIRKHPLDATGTRVIGPTSAASLQVAPPAGTAEARSVEIGPAGLLVVCTREAGFGTVVSYVDPATLAVEVQGTAQLPTIPPFIGSNAIVAGGEYLGLRDATVVYRQTTIDSASVAHGLVWLDFASSPGAPVTLCDFGVMDTTSGSPEAVNAMAMTAVRTPWNAHPLTADVTSASLTASVAVAQTLTARVLPHAGKACLLLGSASGFQPVLPLNQTKLPLAFDAYFALTLATPAAIAAGNPAILDAAGEATFVISLPPGVIPPSLAGLTLNHAALVHQGGIVHAVTNPAPLTFLP
jgi:hypothetical protein